MNGGGTEGFQVEDRALEDLGWERRSVIEPARLEEFTELYEGLGLEVMVRPLELEGVADKCRQCAAAACASAHVLIYTRRPR